jgi:hypothetical protein
VTNYVADRVTYAMNKVGETGTLVRLPGTTGTRVELTVKVVPSFETPTEPLGGVVQSHREARIGNAEIAASNWPAPIKRGDLIILSGISYAIQGVQTSAPDGTPAIHLLYLMRMG